MKKEENLFTPDCIRTLSGKYVNVLNPDPETIVLEDIIHSLSHQCRFAGHLPRFYSVAQHSYLASKLVKGPYKKEALFHDASEAYMIDLPRPIKQKMESYKSIEDNFMKILSKKFNFIYPFPEEVHEVDNLLLKLEWDHLFINPKNYYIKDIGEYLLPMTSIAAKNAFRLEYSLLTKTT